MRFWKNAALATLVPAAILMAHPAGAQIITAKDIDAFERIVKGRGSTTKIVAKADENPYIEARHNNMKYLVIFMNCDDDRKNCKTVQYYLGFTDAKNLDLAKFNHWNSSHRFARAYRDDEGDPVLEMDVDLDPAGLAIENVGESLNTWTSLMDSYREYIFDTPDADGTDG